MVVALASTVTGADVLAQARYWLQHRLIILIDLFCDGNPSGSCELAYGEALKPLMVKGGIRMDAARE